MCCDGDSGAMVCLDTLHGKSVGIYALTHLLDMIPHHASRPPFIEKTQIVIRHEIRR